MLRPSPPDAGSKTAWSPAVLRGRVVPTAGSVTVDLGTGAANCRCVGLAEDGFVIESDCVMPLNRVLRCRLVVPEVGELELFAFAAAEPVGDRQEMKPMGMSGEMAERWLALRQTLGGVTRARGTGPTRPLKSGGYTSIPRSRSDWFWRILQRVR